MEEKMNKIKNSVMTKSILSNVAIILVMVVVLTIISYFISSKLAIKEIQEQISLRLESTSDKIMTKQQNVEDQLNLLSKLSIVRETTKKSGNNSQVASLFEEFSNQYGDITDGLFITDQQGIINANLDEKMIGVDLSEREYYKINAAGNIAWSDVLLSKASGDPVRVISVPIKDDNGDFLGMIGMAIKMQYVYSILSEVKVGEKGYAFLVGSDQTLLYHPKSELIGTNIADLGVKEVNASLPDMLAGKTGIIHYTFTGVTKTNMFAPVGNWSLSINAADSEFLKPIKVLRNNLILVSFVFLLIAVALIAINSYLMVRKIHYIQKAMESVSKGNLATKVKDGALISCKKTKNCSNTECAAFNSQNLRCWEISDVECCGEGEHDLLSKLEKCKKCKVYKHSEGDEINQIARGLNNMTASIKLLINHIKDTSIEMTSASEELSSVSEESSAGAEEISKRIGDLSYSQEEQNKFVETVNVMAIYMNDVLSNSVELIMDMANSTEIVNKTAHDGQSVIQSTIQEMKEIKAHSEKTVQVMETLNQQSGEINNINSLITQIAQQTNLLALNAAIEAARAGEQGKGFAVVADEIRKLAFQSQESANGINQLIQLIQNEISTANQLIISENGKVEKGIDSVVRTEQAFSDIENKIKEVVIHIDTIIGSIDETKASSLKVVDAVGNIVSNMQESVACSEEVNATTEEQTSIAEGIAESAKELADMAGELLDAVSKFTI